MSQLIPARTNYLCNLCKFMLSYESNTIKNKIYYFLIFRDSEISVATKDNQSRKVKIVGIDDFGYLTVKSVDGTVSAVQPDGNTFDMLKGLIAPKIN